MKNSFKQILKIFGSIFIFFALILSLFYLVNTICLSNEFNKAKEYGLVNTVLYDDNKVNALVLGNENSEYAIVTISGLGVNNFNFFMKDILEPCFDSYQVVLIDRLGYGLSSDTKEEQTIENIVRFYQEMLNVLNINKKIVLLAHSIGGLYATYWQSTYPDEIAGVIILDGSIPRLESDGVQYYAKSDYITSFFCKIGFQRIYNLIYKDQTSNFFVKKELQSFTKIYDNKNINSYALISESLNRDENYKKAFECIKTNDIPKMYVLASDFCTKDEFIEYYEFFNWVFTQNGKDKLLSNVEEYVEKNITEEVFEEYKNHKDNEVLPYIKSLGNCNLVRLPGVHTIYEQKGEEVGEYIQTFMNSLMTK